MPSYRIGQAAELLGVSVDTVRRGVGRTRRPADGVPDRTPIVPVAVAAVAALLFALPLAGLAWRAPWSSAWTVVNTAAARDALRLSLVTSVSATAIAIVLGVPLAWVQ